MANPSSDNYTASINGTSTSFSIPDDASERFSRSLHLTALANALENHDHSSGKGLDVSIATGLSDLTVTDTTDAASVQIATFQGDRATPADNDEVYISYKISNEAGVTDTQVEIGRFTWVATDVTNSTTVEGRLDFAVMTDGTLADELQLDGTALSPSTNNGLAIGTSSLNWSDLFLADGAVINLGNDQDVTLTHIADAGILINSDNYITFRDSALKVYSSADGQLDIDADTEIEITTTTVDLNGNLDVSGTLTQTGIATFAGTVTVGVDGTGHDVKFFGDTSGKYMLWDESADGLIFTDNTKALFGTGSDLEIFHDASDSYIKDNGTGRLVIETNGTDVSLKSGSDNMAVFTKDGASTLYYDNSAKIATHNTGVEVTGSLEVATIDYTDGDLAMTIADGGAVTFAATPVFSAGIAGTLATAAQANVTSLGTLTALNVSGSTSLDGAVIINNSHADADTRIETDTNDSAFFVNAGSFSGVGSVGIGDDPMVGGTPTDYAAVLFDHPAITQAAGRNFSRFHVRTGSAVTIPSGTTSYVESVLIEEPNITATGTVTTASTLRIPSAPSEGTNNYALLVDAGNVRIDDSLFFGTTVGLSSGATNRLDLATGDSLNIVSGDIFLADSKALKLGTGNDASIYYDGTNLVVNPKVVGSGTLYVAGTSTITGDLYTGQTAGDRVLVMGGANATSFQTQVSALGSSGFVYMDWSVAGGNSDYDSRIIRTTGANGALQFWNRGTGTILFVPGTGDYQSYFNPNEYSQTWYSGSAGNAGPYHHIHHNSASPADNDQLFYLRVDGEDSASNQTVYGYNRWLIGSPTDGAEWVYVDWHLLNGAGVTTQQMKLVGNLGRLELPITGSNAGILIGTDTQLYRGDTNWLYLASGDGFSIRNGRQYNIYYDTTTSGETDVNTLVSHVQPGGASSSTTDTLQIWTQTSTANNITGRVGGITEFVGHNGTGTLTFLHGELIDIRKQNTGPVTNAYGVYIDIKNENATNAITNAFGLYVAGFTATGAITNRYGIYQAGASETNYFAGPITANSGLTQNSTGVGMKVAAWSTSIGLGIQSSLLEFITDSVHADFRWGYGASGLLTEVMFLDSAVGRLALPSTDANSGILLGGDVQFFRGAANRLDLASGDSFNIVGGLLTVTGGYFGDAASTTAKLTTGNGTTSRVASLSFNSTFYSHADTGARRTADITAGYSTGAWGTEYLSFNVGGAGDSYNKTYEIVRITEGVTDGQGAFTVKPDNTASFTNPSGRWAALIQHPSNAPSRYGLSVCTTWASDENKVFEVARQWDGVSTNYYPMYYIDGVGTLTVKDAVAAQNTVLTIDSSGKMLIGGGNATAGNQTMDVYNKGTGATNYLMIFNDVNSQVGSISHNAGDVTAFSTASDYRLKENETAITNAITRVKGLKPYRFNFKQYPSNTLDGFFAHEVAAVVPEAVTGVKDEMKLDDDGEPTDVIQAQGVDSAKLVPLLTAALQEAIARIEALEARI